MAEQITKQQIPVLAARVVEFQEKFGQLSKEDGQFMIQHTAEAIEIWIEAIKKRNESNSSLLETLLWDQDMVLLSLTGGRLIHWSKKVFKGFIDYTFAGSALVNIGVPTLRTTVQVRKITGNVCLMDIFTALPGDWEEKCLSQNQVVEFCEGFPGMLSHRGNTFFLIKKDEKKPVEENNLAGNIAVARVCRNHGGKLSIYYEELSLPKIWDRTCYNRVVSPMINS